MGLLEKDLRSQLDGAVRDDEEDRSSSTEDKAPLIGKRSSMSFIAPDARKMETLHMTECTPEQLMQMHRATGEPLYEAEVQATVEAGLTTRDEWEDRGGALFWHVPTFPDLED